MQWIVNDSAELGVMLGGRCFFLYKGGSLEYSDGTHDDGSPMLIRPVGKREFGECCHPLNWKGGERYTENLVYTPGLSFGKPEDGNWRPILSSQNSMLGQTHGCNLSNQDKK